MVSGGSRARGQSLAVELAPQRRLRRAPAPAEAARQRPRLRGGQPLQPGTQARIRCGPVTSQSNSPTATTAEPVQARAGAYCCANGLCAVHTKKPDIHALEALHYERQQHTGGPSA